MISCFVRADRLRLAALFTSKDPLRTVLCGVFVEPCFPGVRLAATDGVGLGMFLDEAGEVARPMIVALPKSALQAIKAVRKHDQFVWFGIVGRADRPGRHEGRIFDANDTGLTNLDDIKAAMSDAVHDGVIWSGAVRLIDGEYPAVERVIPRDRALHSEGASFSGRRLAPFVEVAASVVAGIQRVRLYPAGAEAPILVECCRGDFVGVLMPTQAYGSDAIRVGADFATTAAWALTSARADAPDIHTEADPAPAET